MAQSEGMQAASLPGKERIYAEWVKVFCLLIGVAATPLLTRFRWLDTHYWAAGMASGSAALVLGIFFALRGFLAGQARAKAARLANLLTRVNLKQRLMEIRNQPEDIITEAAQDEAAARLKNLAAQKLAGLISDREYRIRRDEIVAASAPQETNRQAGDQLHAMELICVGIFILLPAVSALLLQTAQVENADLVYAFLSSPAIVTWIVFELLRSWDYWTIRKDGIHILLGLAAALLQICSAWLIWNYLGQAYTTQWADVMFGMAVFLALFSAAISMQVRFNPASVQPSRTSAQPLSVSFPVFFSPNGNYYFQLEAINGEKLLTSEEYRSLAGCLSGMRAVKKNASRPDRFLIQPAVEGGYSYILRAANGRILATGPNYASQADCEVGAAAVRILAASADVPKTSTRLQPQKGSI